MTLLTKAEAAARAKVSAKTIAREIAAGRLTPTRIRGTVRIAPADLEEYLQKCRSAATGTDGKFAFNTAGADLAKLLRLDKTPSSSRPATGKGRTIIALDERRTTPSRKLSPAG